MPSLLDLMTLSDIMYVFKQSSFTGKYHRLFLNQSAPWLYFTALFARFEDVLIDVIYCPVGWSYGIHRVHYCREVRLPNDSPGYDTKQSDGEVPVMLEI